MSEARRVLVYGGRRAGRSARFVSELPEGSTIYAQSSRDAWHFMRLASYLGKTNIKIINIVQKEEQQ